MKDNLIVRFAIPQNLLLLSVTCPVMYSCSSILEQKSSRKSCRKAVSLRFHFPFSSFWLSYTTPWVSSPCPCFNFTLPKQCSLPLIVVESCHDGGDAGENSHPADWSKLHLYQYLSEEEATVMYMLRGRVACSWIFRTLVRALSSCLLRQLFSCVSFPHISQYNIIWI